jgi:hypothetical protein
VELLVSGGRSSTEAIVGGYNLMEQTRAAPKGPQFIHIAGTIACVSLPGWVRVAPNRSERRVPLRWLASLDRYFHTARNIAMERLAEASTGSPGQLLSRHTSGSGQTRCAIEAQQVGVLGHSPAIRS